MNDYADRAYLSAIEAAKFLKVSVSVVHDLVKRGKLKSTLSASGQQRFDLRVLEECAATLPQRATAPKNVAVQNTLHIAGTTQTIYAKNAMSMDELSDESIHLMITSPPYYNAKMYSKEPIPGDLGNIHDLDEWFERIGQVWKEVYRVLQPGRKAFINIMNLPIREKGTFRSLNLVGRTTDLMESIGFVSKRDIIWHKTNAVRAHFGSYPYPGSILINNMHEFILEFEKPPRKGRAKYGHLTAEQKERSKLDKEFWLTIKASDVWVMHPERSGDGRTHVAPFPLELPYRLIKAFSYVGETVLDPFLGSGTTLEAATMLGRNGVGYEIVPEIATEAVEALKR